MENLEIFRLEDEPVIISRARGHVTLDVIQEIYRQVAELRQDMPKNIYRISNFTEADTSFSEMMQIMQTASKAGSQTLDPSVTVVYVSTSHWAKLAVDALRQNAYRGREIPIFTSEDEALAYVRSDIAAKADSES